MKNGTKVLGTNTTPDRILDKFMVYMNSSIKILLS